MTLLTDEKYIEFLQSGKFCEIFGHTMENKGKSFENEIQMTSFDVCKFCHRSMTWQRGEEWKEQDKGGLEFWS